MRGLPCTEEHCNSVIASAIKLRHAHKLSLSLQADLQRQVAPAGFSNTDNVVWMLGFDYVFMKYKVIVLEAWQFKSCWWYCRIGCAVATFFFNVLEIFMAKGYSWSEFFCWTKSCSPVKHACGYHRDFAVTLTNQTHAWGDAAVTTEPFLALWRDTCAL